ncbi:MAG: alpha/beta hydrolase [Desulfobacterales bacterium]|jgi:alpha-beta hydrolase superfamily lysophospholipase|nr:alpha/beta hydrolase [Desulfobacterales bacterium]
MVELIANSVCKKLSFFCDGYRIEGHLHLPSRKKPPVVIGSHGLFATQDSPKQLALAHACNLLGMAFFRFDHRGCGQSEGGQSERISFEGRCHDLFKACETMKKRDDTGDAVAIFGSSMGGAAACRVSAIIQPNSLVTFAAPITSKCILDPMLKQTKGPLPFFEGLSFDIEKHLSYIRNVLVIHGENDEVVPVSEAHKIYRIAGNPKKLMIQENGDHRMSSKAHQDKFFQTVAEWFNKGFE